MLTVRIVTARNDGLYVTVVPYGDKDLSVTLSTLTETVETAIIPREELFQWIESRQDY